MVCLSIVISYHFSVNKETISKVASTCFLECSSEASALRRQGEFIDGWNEEKHYFPVWAPSR